MRTRITFAIGLTLGLTIAVLTATPVPPGEKPDAFSQATPRALAVSVPGNIRLSFRGEVAREYVMTGPDLARLAAVRIRTREVNTTGEIMGTYIYQGIPVLHILEGIAPRIPPQAPFDRPLDLVVSFVSRSGRESRFSYCELILTDDRHPVTLAYHRRQLLPAIDPQSYTKNRHRANVSGLRLICPRDRTDSRYLDDVVAVKFIRPATAGNLLPPQKKGKKCASRALWTIEKGVKEPASLNGLPLVILEGWFRTGHGRGIKSTGLESTRGYPLRAVITRLFPHSQPDDFFLFAACDGYRSLLSWREIFETEDGCKMLLTVDRGPRGEIRDLRLACVADYFVDRNIWGLSHIQHISLTE